MTAKPGRTSRRWIGWTVAAIIAVLLIAVAWVGIRGATAAADLQNVKDGVSRLRAQIEAGDLEQADAEARSVSEQAAQARSLTGDLVWRTFELLPWIGSNLTAVREVSEIADDVASDALRPLLAAAEDIDLQSLGLRDGALDLAPLAAAEPPLAAAADALSRAAAQARGIDADATVPQLAAAVAELRDAVDEASGVIDTLHSAAALTPTMLGADGPRTYMIAMLNNAELRSAGGIAAAFALVRAENGGLSIVGQASTSAFPGLDSPLPLSASTVALFEDGPGRYMQNLASIPDFAEAATAMAARWQQRFDDRIDGVVAIDTVVARDVLAVVGPQKVGPYTIDADNVLNVLLSKVYRDISDPEQQDAVFALTATTIFDASLHADDPRAVVAALGQSVSEGRIHIWSAHDDEQRILKGTDLGGVIPDDRPDAALVGVMVNDTTGGKMDVYARSAVTVATGVCHGAPTTRVTVTWSNDVPAEKVAGLPPYVTANGWYGVEPGDTRTLIAVYGPTGATLKHFERDGRQEPVQTADLDGRLVVQHNVTLRPGESSTITVDYVGTNAGAVTQVRHTPMTTDPRIEFTELDCRS